MPTYEYVCTKCKHRFDAFQKISQPPLTQCPLCSGPVQRIINGGAGMIFKGSGFYITDYKKEKKPAEKEIKNKPTSEPGKKAETTA